MNAYEIDTHEQLTKAATTQSALALDSNVPARLGLRRPVDSKAIDQQYPDSHGQPQSIMSLITGGARFEDDGRRPAHHFFNPVTGNGAHIDLSEFPYVNPVFAAAANAYSQSSPDWALGQGSISRLENAFAWTAARDYMFSGLTFPNSAERRANWGAMFESLGRVVHHIQDMAQPQHVRNDLHWYETDRERECDDPPYISICGAYLAMHRESAYEKWTNRQEVLKTVLTPGFLPTYQAVYPASDVTPSGLVTFSEPRRFWTNGGLGMADFTNRNFFSENTVVDANAAMMSPPVTTVQSRMRVVDLCNNAVPPCSGITDPDEWIYFWSSNVDDRFRTAQNPMVHPFAASQSIFSPEFESQSPSHLPFVRLNRFTFAYDHLYLLPRAVGYSAGLINYFFRGDMEIALPPEGVYAIVDARSTNCGGACFQKLKLKVRNTTPNDDMGAGALRAVVKYHRNTCFKADLSGEYGGPAFAGASCRDAVDRVAVSDAVGVAAVDRAFGANAIEFTFPAGAGIPIDASDIYLQVVFRGVLGQEADAVAVTTKDIAEPNFIAVANMTDYVYDDLGDNLYHPVPTGSALGVSNLGIAFGANTTPLVTMPGMGGGEHAQVAFLTDVSELPATVFFSGYRDASWVLEPEEFTLDDATGRFARSCPVYLARGVYREYQYWFFHRTSDHGAISVRQLSARDQPSSSAGAPARMHPEIVYGCGVPTGGIYDFSAMTPFAPAAALPWSSNF